LSNLEEKLKRLKEKESEKLLKQKRLEETKEQIQVDRDPNRLYKMTTTWKNRLTTPRTKSAGNNSNLNEITHRAVPSWRIKN
jgi:hypothetical protein